MQKTLPAFSGSHRDALLDMQDEPGFPAFRDFFCSEVADSRLLPRASMHLEALTTVLTTPRTVCMQRQGEGGRSGMHVGCIGVIHPRCATHRIPWRSSVAIASAAPWEMSGIRVTVYGEFPKRAKYGGEPPDEVSAASSVACVPG